MPAPKQWLEAEKQDVIRSYQSGESSTSLGLRYGCSHVTIRRWLSEEWNIPIVPRGGHSLECNNGFFDTIDSEEKAYWLGFIVADGCIVAPNRLTVASKDKEHLEAMRSHLGSAHKLHRTQSGTGSITFQLTIHSDSMTSALARLGIHPRKSFTVRPCEIQSCLERHYWRGVFDGDGCISPEYRKLTLVGNKHILIGFRDFCLSLAETTATVRPHSSKGIYQFAIAGRGAERVLDEMYQSSSVHLDRKFLQYQSVVERMSDPSGQSAMKRENMAEERRPSRLAVSLA